ncbi:MAG: hypothetical protein K0R93_1025 [Anaerosolibacter sp.]|jgi:hypothetical protein|uniref:hypothetical protein n=1 Tax=Anaerosolibacter sp. TaxID=1872527 RepID=UPI002611348D|nr:hypothetical protein [Anaerosolibacter sp.]MDF2546127.1 hypothetical protein [Anaerosolibacter sp.]
MDKREQAVLLASAILKRTTDVDVRSNFKDSNEIVVLLQDVHDKKNFEKTITLSSFVKMLEESL